MKSIFHIAVFLLFLTISKFSFAQLTVTNGSSLGLTPAQLVQNWLVGPGVIVSNATLNGSSAIITSNLAGTFIASGNALSQMGIDSGLIVTCGGAGIATGPNNNCDAGLDVQGSGDPDLTIIAGTITYDKCVIEFDFVPVSDTIKFRYVFGSEELFVFCYLFNDPFGFFLSGPGINGTFSNNSVDIARMPNSSNYVTINNICSDPSSVWCNAPLLCGDASYCVNTPSNSGSYFQYNALTFVFTAWYVVQPCSTYHIKIAIADALDNILDSGVFLEKGSFSSPPPLSGPSQPCVNSTGNVYTTAPGMQNYQWTVSQGGLITAGGTPTSNSVTVTWTTTGLQTVSVNYTSTGGCSSPYPTVFNVNVQPGPVPVINGPASVCVNSTGNFYSTQPGMTNYSWSVTQGGTITAGGTSSTNSVTVTWDSTGAQSVSVNYSDSTGCNSSPAVFNVFVSAFPIPAISGPVTICVDSVWNIYKTESGMTNYLWNVSAGGTIVAGGSPSDSSVSVIWNISGNQNVSVSYINSDGCMALTATNLSVTVNADPGSAGNILGVSPVCAGMQNLPYSVQPVPNASSYFWTFPPGFNIVSGNGTNAVIADAQMNATQGTITVYGSNSCRNGMPSPPFEVAVNMPPVANAGADQDICAGIPFTITQASAANFSAIQWISNGSGSLQGSATLTPVYTTGPADTATVVLTLIVKGITPCSNDTSTVNLFVKRRASVNTGKDISSCGMLPVDLTLSHANNYIALQWTTSGSGTFSDPSALHPNYFPGNSDLSNGTVVLTLTGYSNLPCPSDSDQMVVELKKPVSVFAGNDTVVCDGRRLYISSAGAENYSSLEWRTTGDGHFNDPFSLNAIYFPGPGDKSNGGAKLILAAGGNPPCVAGSDTLTLTFSAAPAAMAGPDGNICTGKTYTVSGAAAFNSTGVYWNLEGNGNLENGSTLSPVVTPYPGETNLTLTLFAHGLSACSDSIASDQMNIHIFPYPGVTACQDVSIKYDSAVTLTCVPSDGSEKYSYQWIPEILLVDHTIQNPKTVNLIGDTIFIVMVTDSLTGCTASDSIRVKVGIKEGADECILIHNVITPNGDGVNDKWVIDCIELFPDNNITLLNRWGDVVNTFHNYNNNDIVWNGKNSQGETLPDGTYFYILQIKNGPTLKGWIYLR